MFTESRSHNDGSEYKSPAIATTNRERIERPMMKDERRVEERIAEVRRMMKGGDTVNVAMSLENLEIAVYGSFTNMIETRLQYLEADQVHPSQSPTNEFERRLMADGPG